MNIQQIARNVAQREAKKEQSIVNNQRREIFKKPKVETLPDGSTKMKKSIGNFGDMYFMGCKAEEEAANINFAKYTQSSKRETLVDEINNMFNHFSGAGVDYDDRQNMKTFRIGKHAKSDCFRTSGGRKAA